MKQTTRRVAGAAAGLGAIAALAFGTPAAQAATTGPTVLGLTADQRLVSFGLDRPNRVTSIGSITGTSAPVLGIDVRPATGGLYALAADSTLYVVDPTTAVATLVGTLTGPAGAITLVGTPSIDFNPTVDRLRVVTSSGQNLRVNPANAVTLIDVSLSYGAADANAGATPDVLGIAYENNDNSAATGTRLFDIDASLDVLTIQNPPNNGTLNTVGSLGRDGGSRVGFDVYSQLNDAGATVANTGVVLVSEGASSKLGTIDLATGTVDVVGPIAGQSGPRAVVDIAVR